MGSQPHPYENLSSAVQGQVFYFFSGMPAASFRSQSADSLDTVQRAWPAAGQGLFTSRDRGSLRTDPRQSRSGNSSLSPRACRVEPRPPNWPYGRLDRSPLPMPLETTVGAPLRARGFDAEGSRTDRWPQMLAIPLRVVLQRLVVVVNWIYQCDICNPRRAGGRLGRMGLVGPGSAVGTAAPHRSPPPATERG